MALNPTTLKNALKPALKSNIISEIQALVTGPNWADTDPGDMNELIWDAISTAIAEAVATEVISHIQSYAQIEIKQTDLGLQSYTVPPAGPVATTGPIIAVTLPVGIPTPFPGTGVIK